MNSKNQNVSVTVSDQMFEKAYFRYTSTDAADKQHDEAAGRMLRVIPGLGPSHYDQAMAVVSCRFCPENNRQDRQELTALLASNAGFCDHVGNSLEKALSEAPEGPEAKHMAMMNNCVNKAKKQQAKQLQQAYTHR